MPHARAWQEETAGPAGLCASPLWHSCPARRQCTARDLTPGLRLTPRALPLLHAGCSLTVTFAEGCELPRWRIVLQ